MAATTFLGATSLASPAKLAVKDLQAPSTKAAPAVRAFVVRASAEEKNSRRQLLNLGLALVAGAAVAPKANAGLIDDLLAKSAANKALNDKKRAVTSGANVARAYTVQFKTCQVPYNFVGCEDLANVKRVPFLTEDHEIECQGKAPYMCASNSHWKGGK